MIESIEEFFRTLPPKPVTFAEIKSKNSMNAIVIKENFNQ
jgi:hypothetical protein